MTRVPFTKYEAAGNDFLVVRTQDVPLGPRKIRRFAEVARAILARHTGIGSDGLFAASPPADSSHYLAVRIFNPDGSEAEMSGNGIRCAAAWLLDSNSVWRNTKRKSVAIAIETAAGLKTIDCVGGQRGDWVFRVNMGTPILEPAAIPFAGPDAKAPVTGYALPDLQGAPALTVTSMGNPHCSIFVRDFDDLDWRALGREIERHAFFPNRTNVEFVKIVSRRQIEVRFWERGVGETASSGTGSSAAAVASALNGLTDRKLRVGTPGGQLEIEWSKSGEVYLTGPVRLIGSGYYEYVPGDAAEPA